jgi:hypothetical protein
VKKKSFIHDKKKKKKQKKTKTKKNKQHADALESKNGSETVTKQRIMTR